MAAIVPALGGNIGLQTQFTELEIGNSHSTPRFTCFVLVLITVYSDRMHDQLVPLFEDLNQAFF